MARPSPSFRLDKTVTSGTEGEAQSLRTVRSSGPNSAQKPATFAKWRDETPDDFVFSLKASRFATNRQRVTGYDELRPVIADRLRTRPRQHWIERLTAAGVPCGSVRNLQELFDDPQLAAREMIARVEHATIGALRTLGVNVKLSGTPGSVRTAPPTLGQHTDAVLGGDLRLSAEEIDALRRQRII